MATPSSDRIIGVNEFFAASEARVDRWRTLNRVAARCQLSRRAARVRRAATVPTRRRSWPSFSRWRTSAAIPGPV